MRYIWQVSHAEEGEMNWLFGTQRRAIAKALELCADVGIKATAKQWRDLLADARYASIYDDEMIEGVCISKRAVQ